MSIERRCCEYIFRQTVPNHVVDTYISPPSQRPSPLLHCSEHYFRWHRSLQEYLSLGSQGSVISFDSHQLLQDRARSKLITREQIWGTTLSVRRFECEKKHE